MSAPEFSHILPLDRIGDTRRIQLVASDEERAALKARFELLALESLEADLKLVRDADTVVAKGQLRAEIAQPCIATGESVSQSIVEPLHLLFQPEPDYAADAEIELAADDCDVIFHDGKAIDLGEAVAQSLALAFDPFPRSPNAEAALRAAGVKTEEEAKAQGGPFAGLAALRSKS